MTPESLAEAAEGLAAAPGVGLVAGAPAVRPAAVVLEDSARCLAAAPAVAADLTAGVEGTLRATEPEAGRAALETLLATGRRTGARAPAAEGGDATFFATGAAGEAGSSAMGIGASAEPGRGSSATSVVAGVCEPGCIALSTDPISGTPSSGRTSTNLRLTVRQLMPNLLLAQPRHQHWLPQ